MNRTKVIFFIVLSLNMILFIGCSDESNPANEAPDQPFSAPENLNDGWTTQSLTDAGFDADIMESLINGVLANDNHFIHGIVIAKDNNLVFEKYFSGDEVELDEQVAGSGQLKYTSKVFDNKTEHFTGSANKSFISALVGIAIDKGYIGGTNDKLFSYFPDYSNLNNAAKDQVSLLHMLTMTSGFPWDDGSYPIYDPRNDEYQMLFNNNMVEFMLSRNLENQAGSNFHYNSGTTFLLAEIVQRSSGTMLDQFADLHLFNPLGINSVRWTQSNNNHSDIFYAGLYISPRDMAKFGQLILQKGMWNNNRIISESWINESVFHSINFPSGHPPMPGDINGYGYQWWLGQFTEGDIDVYCAAGWGGQFIFIMPEVNMVVVFTSGDYAGMNYSYHFSMVNDFILPAVL